MTPDALYYHHSGRYSPVGVLLALVLSCLAAILVGIAYAYLDVYIPIGGWITFLMTMGAGFLVGKTLTTFLKRGRVRNTPLALLVAAIAAAVLLVTSWEFFVYAILTRAEIPVSLTYLLTHPDALAYYIGRINESGAWTISGTTPTGIFLTILWIIEAGLLAGTPLVMTRRAINELPFCEHCQRWGATRSLVNLARTPIPELRLQFEQKNFDVVTTLKKSPVSDNRFLHLYLQGCPACDTTQTLCLDEVVITTDKKGNPKITAKPAIRRLLLTPDQTAAVALAVAQLEVPPASPAASEPTPEPAPE